MSVKELGECFPFACVMTLVTVTLALAALWLWDLFFTWVGY